MSEKSAVVMPEDVWFKLCEKHCRARRKEYGGTRQECLEEYDCGICQECASDAIERAPARYRTTPEEAALYGNLPGCCS
jgi:hypothetical protein